MKVWLCVMLMLCDMSGLTSSHHISIDYSEPSITSIGNVQHLYNVFLQGRDNILFYLYDWTWHHVEPVDQIPTDYTEGERGDSCCPAVSFQLTSVDLTVRGPSVLVSVLSPVASLARSAPPSPARWPTPPSARVGSPLTPVTMATLR